MIGTSQKDGNLIFTHCKTNSSQLPRNKYPTSDPVLCEEVEDITKTWFVSAKSIADDIRAMRILVELCRDTAQDPHMIFLSIWKKLLTEHHVTWSGQLPRSHWLPTIVLDRKCHDFECVAFYFMHPTCGQWFRSFTKNSTESCNKILMMKRWRKTLIGRFVEFSKILIASVRPSFENVHFGDPTTSEVVLLQLQTRHLHIWKTFPTTIKKFFLSAIFTKKTLRTERLSILQGEK